MEISVSRKTILIVVAALLLVVGAGGVYYYLQSQHSSTPVAAPSAGEPALIAVAAIYSPNVNAGINAWEVRVCANMTADGCQLFKSAFAPAVWNAAQAGKIPAGISIAFVGVAEKLQDGQEVWKLSTSNAIAPLVYAQVQQDAATRKWMLARLLFSQEAKARYGN